uniref:erythroid membrane-associated protein-like n=1 Tax=Pristiophorus japonicus TaxID=55135 RepID=UPI00398E39AF
MKMDCGTLLLGLFLVCGAVSALGSQPVIRMDGFQGRNIRLRCESRSSSSNLQILWQDGDGNRLISSNSKETEDPKDVFTVLSHITANASNNKYACLVHSEGMKTEGEAMIEISGELFPEEPSLSGWQIAFIVILIVTLIAIVVILKLLNNKRKLFQELKTKIKLSGWKVITNSADSVTMDSSTAHPGLIVSEDKSSVVHGTSQGTPPDTNECFPRILGSVPFGSGKHYWEVEVELKTAWDVGIAKKSADENNTTNASSNIEYWAVLRKDEEEYKAVSSSAILRCLSLRPIPKKIGVYLDCEGKTLSFYNPENQSLLHTFCELSGDLYPVFSPGFNQGGKNSEPLKICPFKKNSISCKLSLSVRGVS